MITNYTPTLHMHLSLIKRKGCHVSKVIHDIDVVSQSHSNLVTIC